MKTLHQSIASKRAEITAKRATFADQDASPAEAHQAGQLLPGLERELADLCSAAHTGENAAVWIDEMIGRLMASPVKSAELTIAIRDLETAGFRLRQHLGQRPE